MLRIADLVDDDATKRDRVSAALKDPAQKNNRNYVDIIIALGMAKEGFDWIWCEHALTVGYRASLTEIVQIIGRATRDAPGKTRARFTNLIAEPDASEEAVTEAVNDTLKAIAASLLMEQVLAPRFEFKPKNPENEPAPGFDYGEGGYDPNKCNVGFNEQTGQFQIEIKGLARAQEQGSRAYLSGRLERGDRYLHSGQDRHRARPVRRGTGARGADPGSHGQDHQGQVPRA
jgi:superfamily II DNA or RNA helicase